MDRLTKMRFEKQISKSHLFEFINKLATIKKNLSDISSIKVKQYTVTLYLGYKIGGHSFREAKPKLVHKWESVRWREAYHWLCKLHWFLRRPITLVG